MAAAKQHPDAGRSPDLLVQLSDLHLRAGELGAGPAQRLQRAVGAVAALTPRPCAVLLSGDLADEPSAEAYEQARSMLQELGLPLHAIPGNHDDRDLLRAQFGEAAAPGSPVHFQAMCGELRVVGCDSTRPGSDAGELVAQELRWLADTLALEPRTPTLLALHHPPVLTGVRSMDSIALSPGSRAALEELLAGHPQVLACTCGHVHTAMGAAFAGRPLLICPSTNSTVRLDLRAREDLPFEVSPQPVGFLVHAIVDGRLVSHFQSLEQLGPR